MALRGKRGAVEAHVLIYVVLVLIAFALILIGIWKFNFSGEVDRSACHESVVFKATIPDTLIGNSKEAVSLKCKTEKSCVTDNLVVKGECESLGSGYGNVRVSGEEVKNEAQAIKFLADEMVECWEMMGQGKVQIFNRDFSFSETQRSACVICSRIAFDEDVQKSSPEIEGFTSYMIRANVPGKDYTYWEFLTNSETSADNILKQGLEGDVINTSTEKSIVFIEKRKTTGAGWFGALLGGGGGVGVGFAVGGFVGGPIGAGIGFVVGAVTTVVGGVAGYKGGDALNTAIDAEFEFKGEPYISGQFLVDTDDIKYLECDSTYSIP